MATGKKGAVPRRIPRGSVAKCNGRSSLSLWERGTASAVERVQGCDSKTKRKHFHSIQQFELFKRAAMKVFLLWDKSHPCTRSASLALGTSPKGRGCCKRYDLQPYETVLVNATIPWIIFRIFSQMHRPESAARRGILAASRSRRRGGGISAPPSRRLRRRSTCRAPCPSG